MPASNCRVGVCSLEENAGNEGGASAGLERAQRTVLCEKLRKLVAQPESFRKVRLEWEDVLENQPKLLHCFSCFLSIRKYDEISLC